MAWRGITVPVPTDENNHRLLDRGTEIFTNRFAIGATATPIFLAKDCKEVLIHYESGVTLYTVRGTIPGRKWFFTETASASADGGNHTVLHSTGHGLTAGDTVVISACVSNADHTTVLVPNGSYTLEAGGHDADHIEIHSPYVAGTPDATGYLVGYRDAVITSSGASYVFPVCAAAGVTILSLATACTVSVIAWR